MKKVIIAAAIILTSGLTALSVTKKENKAEQVKAQITIEKAELAKNMPSADGRSVVGTSD